MYSRVRGARARAGALLALAATLTIALAGCGSSSNSGPSANGVAAKSPSEILATSTAAAQAASSVRVADSAGAGPAALTLNLQLTGDGGRARVSLLGLAFEEIRIANTLYVKGSPAFYSRLARVEHLRSPLRVPRGTWLKAPANGRLAQLAAFTRRSELALILRATGTLSEGAASTVDGQKVIELKEAAKLFTGSLFIASTGQPYPIEIVKRGKESGQITFSGWDRPVTLTAPANAVELTGLERR